MYLLLRSCSPYHKGLSFYKKRWISSSCSGEFVCLQLVCLFTKFCIQLSRVSFLTDTQDSSFCFLLIQPLGIIQSDSLLQFTFGLCLVIELPLVSTFTYFPLGNPVLPPAISPYIMTFFYLYLTFFPIKSRYKNRGHEDFF